MEFNLWIVMKKIIRFFILKFRKKIFMEQIRLVKLHFNIDMTFQTKKKKRILIRSFFPSFCIMPHLLDTPFFPLHINYSSSTQSVSKIKLFFFSVTNITFQSVFFFNCSSVFLMCTLAVAAAPPPGSSATPRRYRDSKISRIQPYVHKATLTAPAIDSNNNLHSEKESTIKYYHANKFMEKNHAPKKFGIDKKKASSNHELLK